MQMFNVVFALSIFGGLFVLLLLSVIVGRQYGKWRMAYDHRNKIETVSVAEGTVFALLGLLVAFTFTGAYERFEGRKLYIIEEANAVHTAYLRIGLLAPNTQDSIKQAVREYVDQRINTYQKVSDLDMFAKEINKTMEMQTNLWNQVLAACQATANQATTMLLIPAMNNMFDIAKTRLAITKIHPPVVIFILLIGLAVIGSLLAGYSMARGKTWGSIHILSYVAITSFTIYIIIDLELPRLGMIRVDSFDQTLIDTRNELN